MLENWKKYVKKVDQAILVKLYAIACEQSDCKNEGKNRGNCAYCADTAESIIGEYLYLMEGKC